MGRLKAFGYQENAEQAKPSSVWPLSTVALLGVNPRLLAHGREPLGADLRGPLFWVNFPAFPSSVALAQASGLQAALKSPVEGAR